jgi:threonine/homoserine/homoserine lactone efflux protein
MDTVAEVFPTVAFGRGLLLGLAVAAPVGPMSLLCMRQTLARGFLAGLVAGLGVATADAVYGAVAALGLVAVADLLLGHQPWLRFAGGTAMIYIGIEAARTRPAAGREIDSGLGLAGAYAATFALTLMNPSTILSFAALFAGLGLGAGESEAAALVALVTGVFLGSALWWLLVTGSIAAARRRISLRVQRIVNIAAGLTLVLFGLAAIASTLL